MQDITVTAKIIWQLLMIHKTKPPSLMENL